MLFSRAISNPLYRQRVKQAYLMQSPRGLSEDWTAMVHYLHIGKTAGSQIRQVIAALNAQGYGPIRAHGHSVKLHHLPGKPRYFFSVRDPVARFRSAFYSRKREGLPLLHHPHHGPEIVAFANFAEATELAETLFAPGPEGARALQAIKAIHHMNEMQLDWFTMRMDPFGAYPPLAIIRQEAFAQDMAKLLEKLSVPVSLETLLDVTPQTENAAPRLQDAPLSAQAIENLHRWYAPDVAFYDQCCRWVAQA